ncbi:MAG: TonB-dependent receptor [Saprospiraceae bacterium]|nr:TonB-dependent receptor [Saprospiraceae bacterium]
MESRMFGGRVRWRGLQFAYYRMARNEHAALGMNPFALSYASSSNRLSERIETYALSYTRQKRRREATHLLSVQRYRISNTSTISHVFDRLNWMAYEAGLPLTNNEAERLALFDTVQTQFGDGVRYGVADAVDVRFETRHRIKLNTNMAIEMGGQIGAGFGTPLNTYYTSPVDLNFSNMQDTSKPFNPLDTGLVDVNTYGQFHYKNKHLTLVAGANVALLPTLVLAPRLALLYRIDSSWAIWANASGGYKQPSVYTNANSIVYTSSLYTSRQNSGGLTNPERVYAGEFGVRYSKRLYRADLSAFLQESYDLVRDGMVYPTANNPDNYILGFAQPEGRSQRVWGIQALFRTKDFTVERNRSKLDFYFEFFMQRSFGAEWVGPNLPAISAPLNMPSWQTQMRYFFTVNKVEVVVSTNRQKEALSKSVLYADRVDRAMSLEKYSKFRTWDVTTRVYLSNHFSMYLMFQNLFNREYTGLDATGTPDDLLYPVQQRRQVRLGVNYSMR